jgi:ribosomal protein S21
MANVARIRVEIDPKIEDREQAFRKMFSTFNGLCMDVGIKQTCKQYETYESESAKKRRKKREAEIQRFKARLRENFTNRR